MKCKKTWFRHLLPALFFTVLSLNMKAQTWEWVKGGANHNLPQNNWSKVYPNGLAVDAQNNQYVMAQYMDTLRLQDTIMYYRKGTDHTPSLFLAKYNEFGERLWARTYRNCLSGVRGNSQIRVDGQENIYMAGYALDSFMNESVKGNFICKMTQEGQVIWMKKLGSVINFIMDDSGNVYFSGNYNTFNGRAYFDTVRLDSVNSFFAGKFDTAGNVSWIRQFAAPIGINQAYLDFSKERGELLVSGHLYDPITINGQTYTTDDHQNILFRLNATNGNVNPRVLFVRGGTNMNMSVAKWLSDSSFVFGTSYNGASNSFTTNAGRHQGFTHHYDPALLIATMDTTGKVLWTQSIIEGPLQFGYVSTYPSAIVVTPHDLYVSGSVMRGAHLKNDTLNKDYYVSLAFVSAFSKKGTYRGSVVGGVYHSLNNINYIETSPQNRLAVMGSQTRWGNEVFFPAGFGAFTLPTLGREHFYFGSLKGVESICSGTDTSFTSNLTGTSFQWEMNTGSGFMPLSNVPPFAGTGTPTLQIQQVPAHLDEAVFRCLVDGNYSKSFPLFVRESPGVPAITTPSALSICSGESVSLQANCSNCMYSWSPATGLQTTAGSVVNVSPAATTTYTVTATKNGCASYAAVTIEVQPSVTPDIQITYTGCPAETLQFQSTVTNGGTGGQVEWYVGNVLAGTGSNFTLNQATNGMAVKARLVSDARCASPVAVESQVAFVNCITTGIPNVESQHSYSLSPNPSTGIFNLSIDLIQKRKLKLDIMDPAGRVLQSMEAEAIGNFKRQIDISHFTPGIYLLRIHMGSASFTEKLVRIP